MNRRRAMSGPRRAVSVLMTVCLAALYLVVLPAHAQQKEDKGGSSAQAQELVWTAGNSTTAYTSAPQTAQAGTATIVFDNSEAAGNTTNMPHTLTFITSDPKYNNDVDLNITARPSDQNGGRWEAEVELTPGTYRYYCAIPGHGQMAGELVVTEPGGDDDTTPPQVTASLAGQQNDDGAYIGSATVTLEATDGGSGVDVVEYAVDDGDFANYEAPVVVDSAGDHTVTYRATDKAGNTSENESLSFTVVDDDDGGGGNDPGPNCPEPDARQTVVIDIIDTGVPNRMTRNGCRINELIEDERAWTRHSFFVQHVQGILAGLRDEGVINREEQQRIVTAAKQSTVGRSEYRRLFDGTAKSFARWQHVGGGAFTLNDDGSMTSSNTVGGLGMLWFPVREYGDFSLKLQFRDDAPGEGRANSGVFTRFPDVHSHPDESRPEWVAIKYGHEVQILDNPGGDQYKTGSVYGFDRVDHEGAKPTPKGTWNDYEIRVVGQHYEIFRNGELINEFDNAPGQIFDPPRNDDPGTDGRQFDRGYIGLQTHGTSDVISFRNIRIKEL